MGKKLNKKLRELHARLIAGDTNAMAAIQSLLHVPSHLQRMSPRDPMRGYTRYKTVHPAKRSGRAIEAMGTLGAIEEMPHRVTRLKMLRDRKERRHATA